MPGCHLVYGEDVLPAEEQSVADGPGQGSHQAVLHTKCRVFSVMCRCSFVEQPMDGILKGLSHEIDFDNVDVN